MDREVERELLRLDSRLMAIEVLPMKVATLETVQDGLKEDIAEIKQAVKDLDSAFSAYRKEDRQRQDNLRSERKRDLWTFISVSIAALAVIATVVSIVAANA